MTNIRTATETDADAVTALLMQYMDEKQIEISLDTTQVTVGYLLGDSPYTVLVADVEDRVAVGTLTVAKLPDFESESPKYFIENLFVDPAFRDSGLGSELIEYAIATHSPEMATSVVVREEMTVGQWFVDQGFQPCDSAQEATIIAALQSLPLKRGAEGSLKYFAHRRQ